MRNLLKKLFSRSKNKDNREKITYYKKNDSYTNCKLSNSHRIAYEKGYGYRCKICGKPYSQCNGNIIRE